MSEAAKQDEKKLIEFLRFKVMQGFRKYGYPMTKPYLDRIEYELQVIEQTNFAPYFLIVADLCRFMREKGIRYIARGSGCGSVVVWGLGISHKWLDPVKYKIPFERFLNPKRVSPPDIDIDMQDDKRYLVIQYTIDRYGQDRVAKIITFGTLGPKLAVKDICRVLEIPGYQELGDQIAMNIPNAKGTHIANEVRKNTFLAEQAARYPQLFEFAQRVEGKVRQAGIHAAGTIIAPDKLTKFLPVYFSGSPDGRSQEDWFPCTQWDMYDSEERGLLKMDYLGLKTLRVLEQTERAIAWIIKQQGWQGPAFSLDDVLRDDDAAWRLLSEGRTSGVFQIEKPFVRNYAKRMGLMRKDPWQLACLVAIIRPGMMDSGNTERYVNRAGGKEEVTPPHPLLADTFTDTFGLMCFQEDVMSTCMDFAGFTVSEADVVRKGVGKKNKAFIDKQKPLFFEGGQQPRVKVDPPFRDGSILVEYTKPRNPVLKELMAESGLCFNEHVEVVVIDKEKAKNRKIRHVEVVMDGATKDQCEEIWHNIEAHSRYSFNNAHAAAYGMVVSYQTAWCKANWPAPYMTFLINSESGGTSREDGYNYKVGEYVEEARNLGLHVLPPCVKRSKIACTMEYPNISNIRFGLGLIKRVSISAAAWVRQHCQQANSFKDFVLRCYEVVDAEEEMMDKATNQLVKRPVKKVLTRVGKADLEGLIYAGAMDIFDSDRCKLLAMLPVVQELAKSYWDQWAKVQEGRGARIRKKPEDVKTILDKYELGDDDVPNRLTLEQLLEKEKDVTGCFLSQSPFEPYAATINQYCTCTPEDITLGNVDGEMIFVGMLTRVSEKVVKTGRNAGRQMAFMDFVGIDGELPTVVFCDKWDRLQKMTDPKGQPIPIEKGKVYLTKVKPDRNGRGFIVDEIARLSNQGYGT